MALSRILEPGCLLFDSVPVAGTAFVRMTQLKFIVAFELEHVSLLLHNLFDRVQEADGAHVELAVQLVDALV